MAFAGLSRRKHVASPPSLAKRRSRSARGSGGLRHAFVGAVPRLSAVTSPHSLQIQPKLMIGAPNGRFEHEADQIADQVTRIPDRSLQRTGNPRPKLPIQHRMIGSEGGSIAPPIVQEALRSASRPLGASTRVFMEARFGRDFSKVRVHTEAPAALLTRKIGV